MALVREHGLLDAKALVAADASIVAREAPRVARMLEEEAARAAAEAEAAAAEAEAAAANGGSAPVHAAPAPVATGPIAQVIDAVKRSPLGLELFADSRGVAAIAGMPDDLVIDAITVLVRERGWFDAKAAVAADAEVLSDAADRALEIREREAAERAAAEAEAAAAAAAEEEEQSAAAAAPAFSSYSAPAAAAPAAVKASPQVAAVLDAIERSPLGLKLEAGARGVAAIAGMPDDLVIDAITVLVRERGWFDAKAAVAADASVLQAASQRAVELRKQEEAERAAALAAEAEAEAVAAAEAEAAAAEQQAAAFSWAAPATPSPAKPAAAAAAAPTPKATGAVAAVIDAIARSPLGLQLSADHNGLSAIVGMVRAPIVL